jgi:hypothetical protein
VRDAGLLLSILNTNSHELTDVRGSGVFLRASLMEHSCFPNCNFSTTKRDMQIIALRPIQPGDNLSIDYGDGWYRPVSARRAALLKSHGFRCFCAACTSRADKSRAFTCPTVDAQGNKCPGVVYPVGEDDKSAESKSWAALVESGAAFLQEQTAAARKAGADAPLLPVQSVPSTYPSLQYNPWSCNLCRSVLTAEQIALCQRREKEAAKALREYADEPDEDEEGQGAGGFDFGGGKRGGGGDEDAMSGDDDEEEEGEEDGEEEDEDDENADEIPPPQEIIARLTGQAAPALHPSHHLIFWSLEFYARSCSSDSDFAADAVPLFSHLLSLLTSYLSPEYSSGHDALMVYYDYLAQVQVVTGAIDAARQSFASALAVSQRVNGASHHSTRELTALLADVPTSADELAERYASFQAALEAALFDSENAQADKNKKAKEDKKRRAKQRQREAAAAAVDKRSAGGGRARGAADASDSDGGSDDDPSASAPGPLHHAEVTPETRAAVLSALEQLTVQRAEEQEQRRQQQAAAAAANASSMQDAPAVAGAGKAKGKGKKK